MHMPPICTDMIRILAPGKKRTRLNHKRKTDHKNPFENMQIRLKTCRSDIERTHYTVYNMLVEVYHHGRDPA